MIKTAVARLQFAVLTLGCLLQKRGSQFVREGERGDENITKAIYAVLGLVLATAIAGAVTAFVNGKLPLIGGQ
ncbi:hypothetical protein SAMN04489729_6894 [Amycolatopsis lurida]|uniref:Uncharacterized protein n=1 Tax=Amycolatopsis lurida NRRL 2430 TaxID=1460371 RepID=A0A2P2FNY6_AMYLU|nr:hypothetical protein [Amycolatopsis lurida]KFU78437.1 hypothetical protein BB31_25005 [Amycolatopsis lurida NRRL 2430]SEE27161.1 hypothetical protein SAMN04489729_6894 [Amycolatopsis lurida]